MRLEAAPGPGRVAISLLHACVLLPVHGNSHFFPPEFSTALPFHIPSPFVLETLNVQTNVATAAFLPYSDCLGPNPVTEVS